MFDSPSALEGLERLIEEFTSRCRDGQVPSVSEFVARYPEHAAALEALLPMVAAMEQLRAGERWQREVLARRRALAHPPEHLGDFRILREIGRGGMGIVYQAEQCSLCRPVAVKVLPKHALILDEHIERFRREARTAARLQHTNIVPVFGVGEHEGLHYYVMPLVRGVGLDEIIRHLQAGEATEGNGGNPADISGLVSKLTAKKLGPCAVRASVQSGELPDRPSDPDIRRGPRNRWEWVARVGLQAAEALHYAHQQGTLHRDIKPGNLLLDENGVVYVADFGLARALDGSDGVRCSDRVGTARYMAPEQAQGAAEARSDIYALGVTLRELVALPCLSPPPLPRDLDAIIRKCLARDLSERYQTAGDLGADLRRFLEGRPPRARQASAVERVGRWCCRNPALAAVSSLAAVLLVVCAITAVSSYVHTRNAYLAARSALRQAEATNRLSLEMLDRIYAGLSPSRVWIAWDADPAWQACACMGLSAGDSEASSVERTSLQTRASPHNALLLENLLAFYDRLAAQGSDDSQVILQSAVASRRVGDIRLCLGQIDQAAEGYHRAIERLGALRTRRPSDIAVATELAHAHNEIGNVFSTRRQLARATAAHREALAVLQACTPAEHPSAEYRYELARTFYFLSRKVAGANEYRQRAVAILEDLSRRFPHAPDYRLLLALCYRDAGGQPTGRGGPRNQQGRQQAIRILHDLVAEYPEVADYRYELIATYAWVPVGLFPWQARAVVSADDEQALRKGLAESNWLVARYPGVPHYGRCQALLLAKLATIAWADRRVAEAEDLLGKSVMIQEALVTRFPDLSPHDRVLLEYFRLRLAQVQLDRSSFAREERALVACQSAIERCIASLLQVTEKPELAGDQLARTSLPLAYEVMGQLYARRGYHEEAHQALTQAKAARSKSRAAHPSGGTAR